MEIDKSLCPNIDELKQIQNIEINGKLLSLILKLCDINLDINDNDFYKLKLKNKNKNTEQTGSGLTEMPREIVEMILEKLPNEDKNELMKTNQKFGTFEFSKDVCTFDKFKQSLDFKYRNVKCKSVSFQRYITEDQKELLEKNNIKNIIIENVLDIDIANENHPSNIEKLKYVFHIGFYRFNINTPMLPVNITDLVINNTYLNRLPDNLTLNNLIFFDCSENQLTQLPDNMNLLNLKQFNCSRNQLTQLPDNMNLPNLQHFNCSFNGLTQLPDNMNLPNLNFLNCSLNRLTQLPDNMNLPNLKNFDCSNNKLTQLPDNMNFPKLFVFDCSNNKLTQLPNNMNYPNLYKFDCSNNKLTELPENIIIDNLILIIKNNPLKLSDSIIKKIKIKNVDLRY